MIFKKVLLAVFSLLLVHDVHAKKYDANELFDTIREKITSVKDYTADVRMLIDISYIKVPPMSGKLYYKAPDKIKLERKGGITILPKNGVNMSLNTSIPEGAATIIDGGYEEVKGKILRILKVVPDDDKWIVLTKLWVDEERLLVLKTETTTKNNGTVAMELKFDKYVDYGLPDVITFNLDVKGYKLPQGVTMDYDASEQVKGAPEKKTKGKIKITYLSYEINKGLSDDIFDTKS